MSGPSQRAPVGELLSETVVPALKGSAEWLVSGSVAMYLHGLSVEPHDLDLWCTEYTLEGCAALLGVPVTNYRTDVLQTRFARWSAAGWEIELNGAVRLRDGRVLEVDGAMLDRARGTPRVQSPEDLICDLLAMDRAASGDRGTARRLAGYFGGGLDVRYLGWRLEHWGVAGGLIEEVLATVRQTSGSVRAPADHGR